MQKINEKITKKILPLVLIALIGLNIGLAVGAADNQLLDPDDPNNYVSSFLKMTGNYTIDDLILESLMTKSAISSRDNFLGMDAAGDYVFSFDFGINSITDDLAENTVSEYTVESGMTGEEVESRYILSNDMNFEIQNLTDIGSGDTFLYNPTTALTVAEAPYLWIDNIYSAATSSNTTIIVKQGSTSTTILNELIPSGSEVWYDLSQDFTPTTIDNITISNSIIDRGVYLYDLDGDKTVSDTRYLTTYVDTDSSAPYTVAEITGLESTFDREVNIDCHHVVTTWGNQDILELKLHEKIVAIEDLIDDVGDIKDYAVTTARVTNALPLDAFQVAKQMCEDIEDKTTTVRDFAIDLESSTITSSKVVIDDPSDAFDDEFSLAAWWQWFKQNTENCWDITKAAAAAILHGETNGEWGVDVTAEILDAQGEINNAPTCLQSISDAMYKAIGWYLNYAFVTIPATAALGILSLIGVIVIAKKVTG